MTYEGAALLLSENLEYRVDYLACCDLYPGKKKGWLMQSLKGLEFAKEHFKDIFDNGYIMFDRG